VSKAAVAGRALSRATPPAAGAGSNIYVPLSPIAYLAERQGTSSTQPARDTWCPYPGWNTGFSPLEGESASQRTGFQSNGNGCVMIAHDGGGRLSTAGSWSR